MKTTREAIDAGLAHYRANKGGEPNAWGGTLPGAVMSVLELNREAYAAAVAELDDIRDGKRRSSK